MYVHATEVCIDDGSINIGVLCNQPPIWCHCADSLVGSFLILFSWPARQFSLISHVLSSFWRKGLRNPFRGMVHLPGLPRYEIPTYVPICKIDWENEGRTMESRMFFSFAIQAASFRNWFRNKMVVSSRWIYTFFNKYIYTVIILFYYSWNIIFYSRNVCIYRKSFQWKILYDSSLAPLPPSLSQICNNKFIMYTK